MVTVYEALTGLTVNWGTGGCGGVDWAETGLVTNTPSHARAAMRIRSTPMLLPNLLMCRIGRIAGDKNVFVKDS